MKLQGNVGLMESQFGPFGYSVTISPLEIVVMLAQDRCTLCAECTIGLEIFLDAHD
jgi:hypothetical protein